MRIKIVLLVIVAFLVICVVQPVFAQTASQSNVNVVLDDFNLVIFPDQRPYIDANGRTLVPVRFISEELGATVNWDPDGRVVRVLFEGNLIRIPLNNSIATVSTGITERQIDMGTRAVMTNNRVMVPLRFVSEALGSLVFWDNPSRTVFIERAVQRRPDPRVIEAFERLDQDIFGRISRNAGFRSLKNWGEFEGARTSTGEFVDYLMPLTERQFADTFYFEFNTTNPRNVSWVSIYFSTNEAQTDFFFYDLTPDVIQDRNFVVLNRNQFQVGAGNPNWRDITHFRIAMESRGGTSFSIDPKRLATYNGPPPMVTLWFDDGWEDNYTNAFQITSRIDPSIRGAIGLVASLIGTDRYLKRDQLTRLKAGGWEFVNHSYTHPNLTQLSNEEIRFEIERNFSFISNYDPIGAYHFVVPFSAVNDRVLSVIRETQLSARYVAENLDAIPFDRYGLSFVEVTNRTDFRTIRNAIDQAIENNQWVGLLFHRIEDPANDRYSFGTQEFEQLVYYLSFRKNDIRVVTPSEAFALAGIPIRLQP